MFSEGSVHRPTEATARPLARPGGDGLLAKLFFYLFASPYVLFVVEQVFLSVDVRIPTPLLAWPLVVLGLLTRQRGQMSPLPWWSWWPTLIAGLLVLGWDPRSVVAHLTILCTAVLFFRLYVGPDVHRWVRVCRLFWILLGLSGAVLIVSRFDAGLGLELRRLFMANVIDPTLNIGLAAYVHTFGYQMAAFGGLVLTQVLTMRPGKHTFWVPPLLVMFFLTVMWSMQRSAVVGILAGAAICLQRVRMRQVLLVGGVLAVTLVVVGAAQIERSSEAAFTGPNVYSKHVEDQDVARRLQMQLEALQLIPHYPLGHLIEGYRWAEVIARHGGVLSVVKKSPHNVYLQVFLLLGIPVGILMVWGLVKTAKAIRHVVRAPINPVAGVLPLGMSSALVATMVNATMHNESLFKGDGPTVFCFVAVWHWYDVIKLRSETGTAPARDTPQTTDPGPL